jgi:hypothetical protein
MSRVEFDVYIILSESDFELLDDSDSDEDFVDETKKKNINRLRVLKKELT